MLAIDSGLWDNLVYQAVTQKDFYSKETLMQFLHLNQILSVYTDGAEDVYNDVIKAKNKSCSKNETAFLLINYILLKLYINLKLLCQKL
ncbi:hypothetical protein QX233_07415 [Chryseobacterium gambrini]|uniref:Uncharacterized protein n=1 Tax=Chryseobacterium gambrini TaxID=373672 RepID=A0AAJ1R4Q4_9FLAO|nr:hypothetical protein [Chryseobacterium gambrini]MDN4012279.1 hypothetical protein [Chryseobacterium gambrini]